MAKKKPELVPELPTPPAPLIDKEESKELGNDFDKKTGISSKTLKAIFDGKTKEQQPDKIKKLLEMLHGRVREGRRLSLRNWRAYVAIDEAFNVAFRQITPTLIGKIFDTKKPNMRDAELETLLQQWGISTDTLFINTIDEKGEPQRTLNMETFWKIFVPLVKSVTTVRAAKMYNDRDNDPFFRYEPSQITEESMAFGQILTQIFRTMTAQMGYKPVARHIIQQTLKYGKCVSFPSEAWHVEWDKAKGEKEAYPKKEGLRYSIPHPTRYAIDPGHRPSSINSDTGVEWGCFWELRRYGDVKSDPLYYNMDKIPFGSNWTDISGVTSLDKYFEQIYPCRMNPPIPYSERNWYESSKFLNSREATAAVYADAQSDTALFLTNLFCKLSPSQWGLGDYEPKLWFRFLIAADDTIIWAEPLPYTPMVFYGYDTDENAQDNCGIALEALPFQDFAGNILSQHMLAIKQNLTKLMPYDTDQLTVDQIRQIEVKGKQVGQLHFIPFSSDRAMAAQIDPSKMFLPVQFPQQNTVELVTALQTVINVMERILQMSAQEVGAVAGHTQTAEEIKTLSGYTNNRVQFSGTFIDDGFEAWKRQLYEAAQAFMSREFAVTVSQLPKESTTKLQKLGFKLEAAGHKNVSISGDFSKVAVDAFISQREGPTRTDFEQIAKPMLQAVMAVSANQILAEKVGAEWIVHTIEQIAKMSGAPKDFGIPIPPENETLAQMKKTADELQQMVQQIQQGAVQQSVKAVGEAVAPAMQQTQQAIQVSAQENAHQQQQIDQIENAVKQLVQMLSGLNQTAAAEPPPPAVPGMVPMA